jgi:small-conductance mechanosensitive channel
MDYFAELINYKLFPLGQTYVTPIGFAYFVVGMILLVWATGRIKSLLAARLLARTPLQPGARQAIATIARYLLLFVGFIVILQAAGIDLTAFNVLAGAIGIGIGLGLQNIANNFISGIIILIERPVQVGDFIDVDKVTGTVESIGPRSTRIRTNDNITIIVPNKKLIDENVVNWSYRTDTIRFRIPAQLVHDTDIDLATRLMCEAATECPDVADEPKPAVRLMKVDATGLHFELRAWSKKRLNRPGVFTSEINFAMMKKFRENNIHLYNASSSVMDVRMLDRVRVEEDAPADGRGSM